MSAESYLPLALREFARLRQLADRALAQLPADAFFAAPAPGDNSIAQILKHVGGNLLSRWTDFLTTDGEKPGRDRDTEFVIFPADTRDQLLARWTAGWAALFSALTPLQTSDLDRTVTPNMTFGAGVHACAGTYYASAVVRIALEELFDTIPNLELDETHDVDFWGWGFRGPKELHVTWEV